LKLILFSILCLALTAYVILPAGNFEASARCPNGYHKDESGECEKVVDNKGKPRCKNGYHRSPDGDCEKVNNGNDGDTKKSDSKKNDDNNNKKSADNDNKNIAPKKTSPEGIELSGPITYVVDGDTLDVNGIRIRLALVDTPEIGETGYESAKNFVKDLCLGNDAEVDIDDGKRGGDRYGREIGVVYCNGVNVNSELIEKQYARIYTDYCDISEFANDEWAGCSTTNPQFNTGPVTKQSTSDIQIDNSNCDSSYLDVCIPSGPPDLDCTDISQKGFSVSGSDPHGFDGDGDGIGCES
jgi:micrococcal nuclease